MSFACDSDNCILRQREPAALEIFLQESFGVFAKCMRIQSLQQGRKKGNDDLLGPRETSIKINRTQHGLQRVGENRGAPITPTFEFAFAKSDQFSQFKRLRQIGQCLLVDQVGPNPR